MSDVYALCVCVCVCACVQCVTRTDNKVDAACTQHVDSPSFTLADNNLPTMLYVASVPQALSRWTISMSLSPADWSPSDDWQLVDTAHQLITQLQTAVDQLILPVPSASPLVSKLVSYLSREA